MALIACSFLTSCGPSSLNEVRLEAASHRKKLIKILSTIESKQDLLQASSKIRKEINALTELMIVASDMEGEEEPRSISLEDERYSYQLKECMKKIYQIEGAREVFENLQRDALHRLDYALFKADQQKEER